MGNVLFCFLVHGTVLYDLKVDAGIEWSEGLFTFEMVSPGSF